MSERPASPTRQLALRKMDAGYRAYVDFDGDRHADFIFDILTGGRVDRDQFLL